MIRTCKHDVIDVQAVISCYFRVHHANISVKCIPPLTTLLYSKNGVYRGIHYFLNFALNMYVLVRTASMRRF